MKNIADLPGLPPPSFFKEQIADLKILPLDHRVRRRKLLKHVTHAVQTKLIGGYSELVAAAWLLETGYEVFRNVCAHGAVDLIAYRDGKTSYIDVKTVQVGVNGQGVIRISAGGKLKPDQVKLGVRALYVTTDGVCDWHVERLEGVYNDSERGRGVSR